MGPYAPRHGAFDARDRAGRGPGNSEVRILGASPRKERLYERHEARSLIGMAEDCEFLPADDPLHERVAAEIEAWIPLFLGVLAGCATVGEWRAWVARYVTGGAK